MEILAHDHPLRTMKQELELHRNCEELRLKLLSEEDVAGYLAKRFSSDGSRQSDSLAAAIHERTDGNPLFMINVVDYLVDAGLLAGSREARAAESAEILVADRIEVPRGVSQMIERNLERLRPEEQAVLEAASVAGAEFSAAAVAAALERPQNEVEACCARLSRREQFVTRRDDRMARRHRLSLVPLPPCNLSGSALRLLPVGIEFNSIGLSQCVKRRDTVNVPAKSRPSSRTTTAVPTTKTRQSTISAGRRARGRARRGGGGGGSLSPCSRTARRIATTSERDRLELALQMALGALSGRPRAGRIPRRLRLCARQLAEKLGETNQLLAMLAGLTQSANGSGQFKLARELAERMLATAERAGDHASLARPVQNFGRILLARGQYTDAQKHLDLGNSYYDESNLSEFALHGG